MRKPTTNQWWHVLVGVLLLLCGYGLGLLPSTGAFRKDCILQATFSATTRNDETALTGAPKHPPGPQASSTAKQTANSPVLQPTRQGTMFPPPAVSNTSVNSSCHVPAKPEGKIPLSLADLDHVGVEGPTACDSGPAKGLHFVNNTELIAPVVILGHSRVNYLARCMMVLLKYWSNDPANAVKFPLYVSIDGGDQRALNFAAAWKETAGVQVITRMHERSICNDGDCHLTGHFKMLLQLFFQCLHAPRLLFLEEDLEVAPDFFSYFAATAPLLTQDPSLWCISAWNDHGQPGSAVNNTALYRTDILPGLGWMLSREHALPLINIWPTLYWDDWMRKPEIRLGRQCVFPEISRTYHFGKVGTHMAGDFFEKYLAKTKLNDEDVDWSKQDLSYLLQDNYKAVIDTWLSGATSFNSSQLGDLRTYCESGQAPDANHTTDLVITYTWSVSDPQEFKRLVGQLPGVMDDIRGERPRASYNGVVIVRCRGRRLFLKPFPSIHSTPVPNYDQRADGGTGSRTALDIGAMPV